MISHKLNLGSLVIALVVLAGCSSAPKATQTAAPAQAQEQRYTYASIKTNKILSAEACPLSDKSWRNENEKRLTAYANACAQLGKWDRVEQLGDWLAQTQPFSPWGAFYLSLAAEQRQEWPRALWMIDLALKKSPRDALLIYQRGRVFWGMGQFARAAVEYGNAIKENPRFVEAHLFLAQLSYRDQDFARAAKHFAVVIELQPDNALAVVGLAETRLQQGQQKDAIDLYERAVSLAPRQVAYRLKLAELYELGMKDYAQALLTYKRLKTLLAEVRSPAEELPIDINEKIRRLETQIQKSQESSKKVSEIPVKGKVKK